LPNSNDVNDKLPIKNVEELVEGDEEEGQLFYDGGDLLPEYDPMSTQPKNKTYCTIS